MTYDSDTGCIEYADKDDVVSIPLHSTAAILKAYREGWDSLRCISNTYDVYPEYRRELAQAFVNLAHLLVLDNTRTAIKKSELKD